MDELIKCEFCGKEYNKYGIKNHIWRNHGEGVNHDTNLKNNTPWNKGLTKDTNDIILKYSEKCKLQFKNGERVPSYSFLNKKHSDESKKKMSIARSYVPFNNSKGKSGWYKGYWCDSTWELAFVIYNLDHDIKFERNTEGFEYIYDNEIRRFYPDFILEDDSYIEIKGYMDDKSIEKIKQFKFKLEIITNNEIKPYLNYVIKTYKIKINELEFLYDDKIIELQKKRNKSIEIKKENDNNKIQKRLEKIEERKNIIRSVNDIDYSKSGWGIKLSKILNLSPQKTVKFVKEHMLDELNPFFNKL